jgi:asparagine synthase (glutamine-hydrolysing)
MGPRWLLARGGYALRRRSGLLEVRCPARPWSAYRDPRWRDRLDVERQAEEARAAARLFFFPPTGRRALQRALRELVPGPAQERLDLRVAEDLSGRQRLFGGPPRPLGWPPDWHRHPETGAVWPLRHWTRFDDFGASDLRTLWEPARFGVVYDLVRLCWLRDRPEPAERFWELIESFRAHNPPQLGVHWISGQECAIRVLACCFGLFGLLEQPATTPERIAALLDLLRAHGQRIEANLGYAWSQKNNHGILEALGLWTLGGLWPGWAPAARWRRIGRRLLEAEVARQIEDDGAYVQHSLNYQRLALQALGWALALARVQGAAWSPALIERYGRCAELLGALTDPISGRAPNYGSNDGSLLLPLADCDHGDQRPTLALAGFLGAGTRVLAAGPWDELPLWLCGPAYLEVAPTPSAPRELSAGTGGYYTLRDREAWVFTRCCVHRDRPAQADQLQLDVWWRGHNLIADPGTFAYDAAPPWNNPLAHTVAHNTVALDGLDQMIRGPRFLWFDWSCGRMVARAGWADGRIQLWEGEHDGYARRLGARHRRAILLIAGGLILVLDEVLGSGRHLLSSEWLFPGAKAGASAPTGLEIRSPVGACTLVVGGLDAGGAAQVEIDPVRGQPSGTRGWFAPSYRVRVEALGVRVAQTSRLPALRATLIALGGGDYRIERLDRNGLELGGDLRLAVRLRPPGDPIDRPLVVEARLEPQVGRLDPPPA